MLRAINDSIRFLPPDRFTGTLESHGITEGTLELWVEKERVASIPLFPLVVGDGPGLCPFVFRLDPAIGDRGLLRIRLRHQESGAWVEGGPWCAGGNPADGPQPWPRHAGLMEESRVCVVAPHPDDEAIFCGGTAARHRQAGADLGILWLTDGEGAGDAATRRQEAGEAAGVLGATMTRFLGFPDGGLGACVQEVARHLADIFKEWKPGLVYVPSPLDWHSDHEAAARAVAMAARLAGYPAWIAFGEFYRLIRPNHLVDIRSTLELKSAAIACHRSQGGRHDYASAAGGLTAYRAMTLGPGMGAAEAFLVVPALSGPSAVEEFLRCHPGQWPAPSPPLPPPSPAADSGTTLPPPASWPEIDLSFLSYLSESDLFPCLESLVAQDYPLGRIHLYARDHSPGAECLPAWEAAKQKWGDRFASFHVVAGKNVGFAAGHNANFHRGTSEWLLCSNVDLTFEPETLARLVSAAMAADPRVAAVEARQLPYEHPKIYDPVSQAPDWCSAACLLMRREAFAEVSGFDETLFLYAEDVDLSFRFRAAGWRLLYCPEAVVIHHADDTPATALRPQHRHSYYGDFLLRLRWGNSRDWRAALVAWQRGRSVAREFGIPAGQRFREGLRLFWQSLVMWSGRSRHRLPGKASALRVHSDPDLHARVQALPKPVSPARKKRSGPAGGKFKPGTFCFHRPGAHVRTFRIPSGQAAMVSLIVRTTGDRPGFLREALTSIARQTYPAIEVIVVQDGGDSMKALVEEFSGRPASFRFVPMGKVGRCQAGNAGLAMACGRWLGFLDDDDLLMADHVETLVDALIRHPEHVAAAAHAMEVPTITACPHTPLYRESGPRLALQKSFSHTVLWKENLFPIQAVLFRRELYEMLGGFDESLEVLEDWDLWIRYSMAGKFHTVGRGTSCYRIPGTRDEQEARQNRFNEAYPKVLAKHAGIVPALRVGQLR